MCACELVCMHLFLRASVRASFTVSRCACVSQCVCVSYCEPVCMRMYVLTCMAGTSIHIRTSILGDPLYLISLTKYMHSSCYKLYTNLHAILLFVRN